MKLDLIFRLVRDLLSYKKSNEKAWLLTRFKTLGSLWKGFATAFMK